MSPATVFHVHLVLGYVSWLLLFGAYVRPRLKAMARVEAQRTVNGVPTRERLNLLCRNVRRYVAVAQAASSRSSSLSARARFSLLWSRWMIRKIASLAVFSPRSAISNAMASRRS